MTYLLDALRWLALLLACWNVRWSLPGAVALARGNFWPPAFYGSVVFWFAIGAATFEIAHLFGSTDLWRLFGVTPVIIALALAAVAQRRGTLLRAEQFYGVYHHLDVALAITKLAEVDPEAARRLADESRRLAAASMVAPRA